MRLWILTDGNDRIGFGHVMRCIALAQSAKEMQMEPFFLVESNMAAELVLKYGFECSCLADSNRNHGDPFFLEEICDRISTKKQGPLLIDGYQYSSFLKKSLSERFFTVYFDDMDMSHGIGNITINYSPNYQEFSYGSKTAEQGYLLGITYFPLRNELKSSTEKKVAKNVRNILVLTGGSQLVQGEDFVTVLSEQLKVKDVQNMRFIGNAFNQGDFIKNEISIECRPFSNEIEEDYQWADLIVTACGITIFEIMYLGIPMICFQLADNQKENLKFVEQSQLAWVAGNLVYDKERTFAAIIEGIELLCSDYAKREFMSEAGRRIVDGQGSVRILSCVKEQYIENEER